MFWTGLRGFKLKKATGENGSGNGRRLAGCIGSNLKTLMKTRTKMKKGGEIIMIVLDKMKLGYIPFDYKKVLDDVEKLYEEVDVLWARSEISKDPKEKEFLDDLSTLKLARIKVLLTIFFAQQKSKSEFH